VRLRARSRARDRQVTFLCGGHGQGRGHDLLEHEPADAAGVHRTDAAVSPCSLQSAPTYMVDHSFISITVDRDMSTNDTIVVFVDGPGLGAAGGTEIDKAADVAL